MYISTEINSFRAYGDRRKIIRMLQEAGFTAYDYSMFGDGWLKPNTSLLSDDYREQAQAFRAYADSIGMPCNQAHAPFPTALRLDVQYGDLTDNAAYNEMAIMEIKRAIEVAGILGAKVCVVHPCNDYTPEQNAKLYQLFEEDARKAGVKIGVENMWNWNRGEPNACAAACSHHDNFKAHMNLLPKDVFVACLDIGHAEMAGLNTSATQMIETLDCDLQALHIHDNDRVHDEHCLPFTRKIDFEAMITALKKIGYQGDVTMEADTYIRRFPLQLYPIAVKLLAEVARYIRDRLQEK